MLASDAAERRRFVFSGVAQRPVPVAQPRLLGAGQAVDRSSAPTICVSLRRTTAIRSIAGRRCRRWRRAAHRNVAALRAGGAPRDDDGLIDALGAILADDGARAGLRRAGAARCRARPTSRARSAATSIPTRSSPRATALRAAIGARLGAALRDAYRRLTTTGALSARTPRAPDGARCATSASTFSPPAGSRRSRSRASQQFHGADNMTDRLAALAIAVAARRCPERSAALDDFYARYARRSAGPRQMVRAAGGDPGAGDARARRGADARIRPSRSPIPTACAR